MILMDLSAFCFLCDELDMDAASALDPVNIEYYDDIPDGGYGW